ncbi:alpha/beta hydrolase [Lactobacillus xylocopicola]|uniref:Alpha/beta hydrolase n=1 Tax=Lactobacillus xylocopicola TaxID=2976676 RepID=A0ABN6SKL6_9LACO|nr:alpha/beta hydrolase [Lactobacillus xylocopicola]BDR59792.1 alpha/beta hydrolase [Lactobacillus xylocopicola]
MTKKSKITITSLAAVILLVILSYLLINNSHQDSAKQIDTPTIFVHGWGSSYHAEESMVRYARNHGASNSVIRADVSPAGKVKLIGTIKKGAVNPIVEANLENNKSVTGSESDPGKAYSKSSRYVKAIVTALQKKYRFKKINLVGHSMGNLQIIYYLRNNLGTSKMPKLNKLVAIAGHYNGLVREPNSSLKVNQNGSPQKMSASYRRLLSLRQNFPRNARVLNIYGDTGRGSDGTVPINSSRTLRYLVGSRARSYQEKEFHGPNAQHSKLHENEQVDRVLIKFLWSK